MKHIVFIITVLVMPFCATGAQSNVSQIEYFLDTDNGFGLNTVLNIISPDVDVLETVMANIPPSTTIGYHKLYIRTKDEDGKWSQTIRKNIEIFPPVTQNNIVMGEYFIDIDPEFEDAISFPISPEQNDIEQAFTAQILNSTSLGYHKLYGRVKDSKGNWSQTFRKNIEVYVNPITNVVEIEYFFGDDLEFGNNSLVSINSPEPDGSWTFNVPYPAGDYDFNDILFVRVKDSNQNWSITTVLDEVASLGTESFLQKSTSVYPNPFDETINISLTNPKDLDEITIYNTLGKEVYKKKSSSKNLNLDFLPQGIYFLQLSSKHGKATFKIVKE
ncbi:T9SS type A sorting domain-containing protein [uncultured Algibacter sp.]|uniref:T9SS type A sorting domain-containing protein n=1 Tax=uncultured Algibacter sp. TaxID=298659 RepID=UPI00262AB3F5|nr:T9SS type A sorting domain-containing protein [uncultured Algibacter sp.]